MVVTIFYYLIPAIAVLVSIRKYRESKWGKCTNKVQLDGKIAIVTGANSGIGYQVAKELCRRGAEVIFACRNNEATLKAIAKIEKEVKSKARMTYVKLDLSSLESVKNFADVIKAQYPKVDILINNAGVSFDDNAGVRTKDGYEIHFGVNHLGHFLLTNLLIDCLEKGQPSRVIIVSSMLHQKGKIDFDNLNLEKPDEVKRLYSNSKLANMYFCKELAKRTKGKGISVYSLCPGWVCTSLFRNHIGRMIKYFIFMVPAVFLFMRTPKQGAQTPIFCATDPAIENESGCMYRDCKKFMSQMKFDDDVSKKLWEHSTKMIEEKGVALTTI